MKFSDLNVKIPSKVLKKCLYVLFIADIVFGIVRTGRWSDSTSSLIGLTLLIFWDVIGWKLWKKFQAW